MACCGDLGLPIVTQPGELKATLQAAGKKGRFGVVYQPRSGDAVEHFEHVGWLCIAAGNCILLADEIDMVCSAGSPINAKSRYWKKAVRESALNHLVQYGRHAHVAMVGVSRAPQDVWRRLTSNSLRTLYFKMEEDVELDAVQGRLGRDRTAQLPQLAKYHYLDRVDGGVSEGGGKL